MKVILLQNVAKVGQRHDVKNVSDGYALNFLIPRKLVEQATDAKVKALEALREKKGAEQEQAAESVAEQLKQLDGQKITMQVSANEKGSLYEKIGAGKVAEMINTQESAALTEDMIELEEPIKIVGEHPVIVRFGKVKASVVIVVEAV